MNQEKYYGLLKETFASRERVATELINLEAILHLPKGTEHFLSDVHGEFEAFDHVLRNGSGSVKEKLQEYLALEPIEENELATLIYYPQQKLTQIKTIHSTSDLPTWYEQKIILLVKMITFSSKKYTRSKVRKALPERFRYIIEELLTETQKDQEKAFYVHDIIKKIIQLGQADELIEDLATTIQRLVVDHLHVVGDIYDRGPAPDAIMDRLLTYHSVDIQWGNHDIVWIAAMAGSKLSLMNLIRICARYGNLDILEERYGVSIRSLVDYSRKHYTVSDPFLPKLTGNETCNVSEKETLALVQEATAILQFKLEGQLIHRRPEFKMNHRKVLEAIDADEMTIVLDGKTYPLQDFQAPTVDWNNPIALTAEEEQLITQLMHNFQSSERLKRHMDFLIEKGSMYLCYNHNLLIHGCIPLHENGDFKSLRIDQCHYSGKGLLDFFDRQVRASYTQPHVHEDLATDILWYLWTGECSSLFGKNAMTTFERYYIKDKKTHVEKKNAYYHLRDQEQICQEILQAFHLPVDGHIINGHTPVKEKNGENPVKANGRMLVIDGGFAKSYQKETGIAGYTLLSNSYGLQLVAHQPFTSVTEAVQTGTDIISTRRLVEKVTHRKTVKETNIGREIVDEIADLTYLYDHFDRIN